MAGLDCGNFLYGQITNPIMRYDMSAARGTEDSGKNELSSMSTAGLQRPPGKLLLEELLSSVYAMREVL